MQKNNAIVEELFIFDAHCDTANVLYDPSSYFIKEIILLLRLKSS